MIKFPHTSGYMYIVQFWLLEKVFLFFPKPARGWEQLSWLVKKEHLFQKSNFWKRCISLKYTLYRSLSMQIGTFWKTCREVLFLLIRIFSVDYVTYIKPDNLPYNHVFWMIVLHLICLWNSIKACRKKECLMNAFDDVNNLPFCSCSCTWVEESKHLWFKSDL